MSHEGSQSPAEPKGSAGDTIQGLGAEAALNGCRSNAPNRGYLS